MSTPAKPLTAAGAILGLLVFVAAPGGAQSVRQSVLQGHDARRVITITAELGEVRQREQVAVFEGAVKAVQGDLTLNADHLRVSYEGDDPEAAPDVSKVEVRGNVRIISPQEQAQSDWGVYDIPERRLVLGGDVIFRQGETVIRADTLTLNLETGTWAFDAPVRPGGVSGTFAIPDRK